MNYQVTANRRRPQRFDQLVGQEFVVATLKNSIESGRIAHAYLFSGPRGVGKTSAARILAKALNHPDGPTASGAYDYPGADEISHGTSMDVIEIDGASNTSVNDVREIKDEVLFAPTKSRYKIYIIDEVHMLSNSAFNALLKTIEEPPPYIVFIFATTEIHKVPATIRSRCQQFNFRLIGNDRVRDLLAEACEELAIDADDEALYWIANEATGSLRDAYTLLDQVVSFSEGHITLEKIKEKLGLVGLDQLGGIADALADGATTTVLELTGNALDAGVSVEQFVIDLVEYLRNVLLLKQGIRKERILGYSPDRFSKALEEGLSRSQLERGLQILLDLYRNLRYSLNQRFELELALSRLANLRNYVTSEELLALVREIQREVASEEPSPASDSPNNVDDTPDTLSKEVIDAVVGRIRKQKLTLGSSLEHAISWKLEGDTVVIGFDNPYAAKTVQQEASLVGEVLKEVLDEDVEVRTEHTKREDGSDENPDDPRVEMVKRVFRGEIVEG
jgi:DNA polymerase-3 subunit gamma/tau